MKIAFALCLLAFVSMANAWDELKPVTLAFVIDTTGSMGNDMRQVRHGVSTILRTHAHLAQQLFIRYVIAPYNDPRVPRPLTTYNAGAVMNFVNRLRPRGGGDCPELAMAGLWNAITHSTEGSIVFFFSDATAKDYRRWTAVRNLAVKKHITLVFVMTGCCGWRGCRSIAYRVYPLLVKATRGALYRIPKNRVHYILNFIVAAIKNGLPALRHLPRTFPELLRKIHKLRHSPCAKRRCTGKHVVCYNRGRSRTCKCHNRRAVYTDARGCRVPPTITTTTTTTTTTPKPTAPPVTCMDMNGVSRKAGAVYTVDCVTYRCQADGTEKEIKHMCSANDGSCKSVGAVWACKEDSTKMTCKCMKDADGIYTLIE